MTDPTLRNWRQIHGILVGEVTGHPKIENGWMTTSAVAEMAPDRSWARTQSRLYRLADPFPDHESMPPGAEDAILARILRNAGAIDKAQLEERLERFIAFAKKLTGPIVSP